MRPNATHLLIAAALLAAPATLGVATQTDLLEADSAPASVQEAEAAEGQTLKTFESDIPEDVTVGELDLRIDDGAVETVAWDQDRYRIEVIQEESEAGLSQRNTDITFNENVDDDKITLEVVVDREGPGGPSVEVQDESVGEGDLDRAIVARVPANLTYDKVHACEGQHWDAPDNGTPLDLTSGDAGCIQTDDPVRVNPRIHLDSSHEGLNVTSALVGLEGEEARFDVDFGDLVLEELDFSKLAVSTDHGDVEGANLTLDELGVNSDYGDVELGIDADQANVTIDHGDLALAGPIGSLDANSDYGDVVVESPAFQEGSIVADHGDIEVDVRPVGVGDLTITADHGEIETYLAHGPNIGYHAEGTADHGDVEIALVDERSEEADVSEEEADENSEHKVAHTANYDQMAKQLSIEAVSDHGDVLVLEDTADAEDESEEDEESSASSIAAVR